MESLNSERAPYGRQPKPAERRGVDSTRSGYQGETYYGQPVLKPSHYGQLIASYLFIGHRRSEPDHRNHCRLDRRQT